MDLTRITNSEMFCGFLGIDPGEVVNFELLGHGEYNINYLFHHPLTNEKLVLRVPMGSQMQLKNQVRYEFDALRLLEPTGRTPKPLFIDDSGIGCPYGFLVMSFLPGRALRYESDLAQAAECLADIHSQKLPEKNHLVSPQNALGAILEECLELSAHYLNSPLAVPDVKDIISILLKKGQKIVSGSKESGNRCIINTELNSGNFLVEDKNIYLVDWEKPLYAYPGQDLGHFLAPTTTLWKTDTVLTIDEIQFFMQKYCYASSSYSDAEALWGETRPYYTMNCLRGITWCSMAWLEYHGSDSVLKDDLTFEKIKYYLTIEFLERIKEDCFSG